MGDGSASRASSSSAARSPSRRCKYPLIQAEPEVRDGEVRFVQSAGGHMGLPAPRRVD